MRILYFTLLLIWVMMLPLVSSTVWGFPSNGRQSSFRNTRFGSFGRPSPTPLTSFRRPGITRTFGTSGTFGAFGSSMTSGPSGTSAISGTSGTLGTSGQITPFVEFNRRQNVAQIKTSVAPKTTKIKPFVKQTATPSRRTRVTTLNTTRTPSMNQFVNIKTETSVREKVNGETVMSGFTKQAQTKNSLGEDIIRVKQEPKQFQSFTAVGGAAVAGTAGLQVLPAVSGFQAVAAVPRFQSFTAVGDEQDVQMSKSPDPSFDPVKIVKNMFDVIPAVPFKGKDKEMIDSIRNIGNAIDEKPRKFDTSPKMSKTNTLNQIRPSNSKKAITRKPIIRTVLRTTQTTPRPTTKRTPVRTFTTTRPTTKRSPARTFKTTKRPTAVRTQDNQSAQKTDPFSPSKERKEFKKCHGQCVQKFCLPVGNLTVYAECVEKCKNVCEE